MTDPRFAAYFFYEEMKPACKSLAARYSTTFGTDITAEEVSAIAYQACWENEWSRLKPFKGNTTIHAWVAQIALQSLHTFLVRNKLINPSGLAKADNYRLCLENIEDEAVRRDIIGLIHMPEMHKALTLVYVDMIPAGELAPHFDGDGEAASRWLKVAETTLIEKLLQDDSRYGEIALINKTVESREIPLESWHDRMDDDGNEALDELREYITSVVGTDSLEMGLSRFLHEFVRSKYLNWNERDCGIWISRFISQTSSAELSEEYGVKPSWIDMRYMHLSRKFAKAIRKWWSEKH